MNKITYQLRSAGYCKAMQHHVLRGTAKKKIHFHATFGLIHHPVHGHILFDTGYTHRFFKETTSFPFFLYAKATKVFLKPEEEATAQLQTMGIKPKDIQYIIISHFHSDHVCGLSDFPNARFVCSQTAYDDVKNRKGIQAVRRAYIPALMPKDFEKRALFIDTTTGKKTDKYLGKLTDLFNDGSILLMDLSGHAKGQIGALLATKSGPVLLAADAAWKKENYIKIHLPSPIVKLFFDSWQDFVKSLWRIHHFHIANTNTPIIVCHCSQTLEKFKEKVF